MKKTYVMAASITALMTSASMVMADPPRAPNAGGGASQEIAVNATVPKFCRIGGDTSPTQLNQSINMTGPGNISTSPLTFQLGSVVCNNDSTVELSSSKGAMFASGVNAVTNFDHFIKYSASLNGYGNAVTMTAGNTTAAPVTSGRADRGPINAANSVTVTVTPTANSKPVLAGSYTDTITVAINPR